MNLTPYNDNFRLNGYYPQVDREGKLIESTELQLERIASRERRQDFHLVILSLGLLALMAFALTLVDMRDKYNLSVIAITQNKPVELKKEEMYNFRKFIGIGNK